MFHRRKKSFFSSSDNSSRRFNHTKLKKAIDKKKIEQPFNLKKENNKLIDKINKKESKVSTFIKTYGSPFIGIISLIYLIKLISGLFKKEYLQLDTFFLLIGLISIPLLLLLSSIEKVFLLKKGLNFYKKTINIFIVFLFVSIIITTISNSTSCSNKINPEDLVSIEVKPKSINLRTTKYTKRIYINAQKYPYFRFKIKNIYRFDYASFANNTNENDILNITITKKDLNRKLNKKEKLTFWDKHFKYDDILVYELRKNNNALLKLIPNQTSTLEIIRLVLLFVFNSILAIGSIILILNIFNIKLKIPFTTLRTKMF
ncbi:hypothetical protein [Tenacibaculum singaporense]|uniref:hypothetical protein n=1 Tax=Tenacibaculum singaporense TaxID=2358479 RepID=UPI000F67ACD3|nr:hypothetical protein [Tenacibaculum singaporense]RSC93084.1 hypothetical protein EI424_11655 [Tenacibaculum singaporense]